MKTQTKSILQVVCPIHKCTLKSLHTYAQEALIARLYLESKSTKYKVHIFQEGYIVLGEQQ